MGETTNLSKLIEEQEKEATARVRARVSDTPLLSLVNVSQQGVIFRSRENFDVGCQIRLGLHVRFRDARDGGSPLPSAKPHSHFVDTLGFVVSSQIHTIDGRTFFQVTLLFDGLSAEDHEILGSVPQDAIRARAHAGGTTDYESFLMGEKTRSVVGLN